MRISHAVLTPAYGRDYKSREEVERDLLAQKDFVLNHMMDTTRCNIDDLEREGVRTIQVRYNDKRDVAVYNLKELLAKHGRRS